MPVKIRLQRRGKKGKAFFWIVAADSRKKRDGKYIEKLGTYNPTTNPAEIELDIDKALKWVQNGAQPTNTARAILSYKGVLLKNHLAIGVRKGALTEEQAEERFNEWLKNKSETIDKKKESLSKAQEEAKAEKLAAEKAVSEKRAAETAAAQAEAEEAEEGETETQEETPAESSETAQAPESSEAEGQEEE